MTQEYQERLTNRLKEENVSRHYADKVYPVFSVSDLRKDLLERARKMALAKNPSHHWQDMNDEETGKRGITLASILLFGDDNLIMSVCYQHKTDAIVRIVDTDRYDDRDVVITNLIESYDRLMAFGKRHLNETGERLEGVQSISARDKILREIVGNSLIYRDF